MPRQARQRQTPPQRIQQELVVDVSIVGVQSIHSYLRCLHEGVFENEVAILGMHQSVLDASLR